jgi:succinate dehydrogenase / fumarate reductase membrane anchor subunit
MSIKTSAKRVHGLGSAKEGVHHWWMQRLTAVLLIPLSLWFVASLWYLFGATRAELIDWLSGPISCTFLILLILAGFYHAKLGMQVVIEDYVSNKFWHTWLQVVVTLGCSTLATACVVSVLKLALGG